MATVFQLGIYDSSQAHKSYDKCCLNLQFGQFCESIYVSNSTRRQSRSVWLWEEGYGERVPYRVKSSLERDSAYKVRGASEN